MIADEFRTYPPHLNCYRGLGLHVKPFNEDHLEGESQVIAPSVLSACSCMHLTRPRKAAGLTNNAPLRQNAERSAAMVAIGRFVSFSNWMVHFVVRSCREN